MEVNHTARYRIADAKWWIELTKPTLDLFAANRQRTRWSRERVGQLFTTDLTANEIRIEKATVLRPTRSSFCRVSFDPELAYAERVNLHARGLHCIGLWHSHPEHQPNPSQQDLLLAHNHAKAAAQQLNGLIFIIVGRVLPPDGLYVGLHDGHSLVRLLHA